MTERARRESSLFNCLVLALLCYLGGNALGQERIGRRVAGEDAAHFRAADVFKKLRLRSADGGRTIPVNDRGVFATRGREGILVPTFPGIRNPYPGATPEEQEHWRVIATAMVWPLRGYADQHFELVMPEFAHQEFLGDLHGALRERLKEGHWAHLAWVHHRLVDELMLRHDAPWRNGRFDAHHKVRGLLAAINKLAEKTARGTECEEEAVYLAMKAFVHTYGNGRAVHHSPENFIAASHRILNIIRETYFDVEGNTWPSKELSDEVLVTYGVIKRKREEQSDSEYREYVRMLRNQSKNLCDRLDWPQIGRLEAYLRGARMEDLDQYIAASSESPREFNTPQLPRGPEAYQVVKVILDSVYWVTSDRPVRQMARWIDWTPEVYGPRIDATTDGLDLNSNLRGWQSDSYNFVWYSPGLPRSHVSLRAVAEGLEYLKHLQNSRFKQPPPPGTELAQRALEWRPVTARRASGP